MSEFAVREDLRPGRGLDADARTFRRRLAVPRSFSRNLMITMVLGSLWHGAAWTFVIWGAYQGLILVLYRRRGPAHSRPDAGSLTHGVRRLAAGLVMFHVTCYGWLIFRAESVGQWLTFSRLLVIDLRAAPNTVDSLLMLLVQVLAPLLVVHLYQWRKGTELAVFQLPTVVRYALYGAVFYLVSGALVRRLRGRAVHLFPVLTGGVEPWSGGGLE